MIKLQTSISDEMDTKLRLYSAYLGLSKNDYIRQIMTFHLRSAEQSTIPLEIVKSIDKKIKGEFAEKK